MNPRRRRHKRMRRKDPIVALIRAKREVATLDVNVAVPGRIDRVSVSVKLEEDK
jgi:hypothetical protein